MPNNVICNAIRELHLLEFTYNDKQGNVHRRVVEPYAHGRTRADKDALRAYQISGTSENTLPGWRLFSVEIMRGLVMSDKTFDGNAPGYAHDDSALSPIHCRVP